MSSQIHQHGSTSGIDGPAVGLPPAAGDPPRERRPAASGVSNPGEVEGAGAAQSPTVQLDGAARANMRGLVRGTGACGFSMLVHVILLVALGMIFMDDSVRQEIETIVASVFEEVPEQQELLKVELDENIEPAEQMTDAALSSAPLVGAQGVSAASPAPSVDREFVEQLNPAPVAVDSPMFGVPNRKRLIQAVPEGTLGEARAIVDDYQQALDRITQEIMWMLDRSDVLVMWCFDQSESMKDDQSEIRERINRVYEELGLSDRATSDHLLTSVTSFGEGYLRHTPRPTSDLDQIREAINSVPVDASGKEMMCQAIGTTVATHRKYGAGGRRQLALIVVTDESGDQGDNARYLEAALAEAKNANCRVYVLGREAVFGYPYAFMRWRHPQTEVVHWLQIDRGPETAFVEQLQTNGFHRRHDAFPSGFGSYEQTRISRETGGIFFLLPSIETNLVRGEKRRYELEAMQAYQPDLRARDLVLADREKYPLRALIWKVINDLNPYHPEAAKIINMRVDFSVDPQQFQQQVRTQQAKALIYLDYLAKAAHFMEQGKELRAQEANPRWQANYDLILAQLIAYQARIYEYGAGLEDFLRNPLVAPPVRPPNLRLVHWEVHVRPQTLTEESKPYIEKAKKLFESVIQDHPGTPWAARAQDELKRGFGVTLRPEYRAPPKKVNGPIMKVPVL